MSLISPLAIIEDGAVIGDNVKIAAHCFVSSQATIGEGTTLAHGACVYGNTTIGKNNRIFSYAILGSEPLDLKYNGEEVELIIGDNNTIREFVLFNPGTAGGGGVTRIGNGNLLMGYVHLGHDVILGNNCILVNNVNLAGHVEMGNHVVVGGLTPVHQFVKIGDFAMIGGASAVTQDVPPYCMAEGNRATLRGLNLTGLRRHCKREDINILKSAYRELFEMGRPLQDVAKELLASTDNDYVKNLTTFIINTKRGIPFERKI